MAIVNRHGLTPAFPVEEFTERFGGEGVADAVLARGVREWVESFDLGQPLAATLARLANELVAAVADAAHPQAQRTARAGLAYLARTRDTAETWSDMTVQGHAYVLSLVVSRVRALGGLGGTVADVMGEPAAAALAEETFESLRTRPAATDAELVRLARAWCANPSIGTESMLMRRLVRNAAFLATVLDNAADHSDEDVASARGALSYLLLAEQGPASDIGDARYFDDAHVLDRAVAEVEPAREHWLRLVEAVDGTAPFLADLAMDLGTGEPVTFPVDVLASAALLCEPYLGAPPLLGTALFLPTTGAVSIALAVVALVDLLQAELPRDGAPPSLAALFDSAAARSEARTVVLVCPPEVARTWIDSLVTRDGPVAQSLPIARVDEGGGVSAWSAPLAHRRPLLVVAASLSDATLYLERAATGVIFTLVDQRSISGVEQRRGADRPRGGAPFETRAPAELEALDDVSLSDRMKACRAEMAAALAILGPPVVACLEGLEPPQTAEVERILAAVRGKDLPPHLALRLHDLVDDDVLRGFVRQGKRSIPSIAPAPLRAGLARLRAALDQSDLVVGVLVRRHMPLAQWMARRYQNHPSYADIVQEAALGLMHAARKYDSTKGPRFGSYAAWWVRQGVESYLSKHTRTIRIPVTTLQKVRWRRRAERELQQSLGRAPTVQELAENLGDDLDTVQRIGRIGHDLERGCIALDEPVDDEGGRPLGETLADEHDTLPVEALSNRQLVTEAVRLLEELNEREAEVLRLRFGLGTDESHTLSEVAELMGVSRERVRQIELRALSRLRFRAQHLGVRP